MDLAALSSSPQRPPTAIEIRPAPERAREGDDASAAPVDAKPERTIWQRAFGDDGLSFGTLLDIINPLQHIPVISTVYQKLTGDVASPAANIIGGALFGGPIGLIVAAADSALKGETGKDAGGHVFALFDSPPQPTDIAVAAEDTPGAAASVTASDTDPSEPDETQETQVADTPALVAAPELKKNDAPKPDADKAAVPHLAAAEAPRSAFVLANSARRTPANGVGGAFVPFETRSTIAPPSLFSPASFSAFATPAETAVKRVEKTAGVTAPDPKTLAANPDQMKKLKVNGMRPTSKPVPLSSSAFANAPRLPAAIDSLAPRTEMPASDGNSDGFADLMARNLERYMSLKNKRPSPSRINQSF